MMVAEDTLPETLQSLVDARLDTIDRMLLGRVPRADRTAIVREVEAQIHELLAERPSGEVDRDQVLSALARLDPPEAYLPEDDGSGGPTIVRRPTPPRPVGLTQDPGPRMDRIGGIMGLVALSLGLLSALIVGLAFLIDNDWLLLLAVGTGLFTIGSAVVGLTLSACCRFVGGWAVIGLVTSLIAVLITFGLIAFLCFFLLA